MAPSHRGSKRKSAAAASEPAPTSPSSSSQSSSSTQPASRASSSSSSHPVLTPYNCSDLHRLSDRVGEVLSFGSGDLAQLGLGSDDKMRERKKPTIVAALAEQNIVQISAGSLHNAALTAEGSVWTWGCNDDGALGRSDDEWIPAPVDGPLGKTHPHSPPAETDNTTVVQVRCGASHTVALTAAGDVYAWGTYRDTNGVMGFTASVETALTPTVLAIPHRTVMIAAGLNHDLALTAQGQVLQWGDVGHGLRSAARLKKTKLVPTAVHIPRKRGEPPVHVVRVFAGGASSFAVTSRGEVFSWGPNNYSQTGHRGGRFEEEEEEEKKREEKEAGEDGAGSEKEATGERKAKRARTSRWSSSSSSFSVDSIPTPTLVSSLPPTIISIAADIHHTLFLTAHHTVYAVGKNTDGRLGLGHTDSVDNPTLIPSLSGTIAIGVGEAHSLFVCGQGEDGGQLWTCGMGELLQLGHGVEEDELTPKRVESQQLDKEGRRVVQAAGGSQHSIILAVKRKARQADEVKKMETKEEKKTEAM